ncbi:hypothetical protein LTR98_007642 [Exophiala xenobiotica]|nr:hypothetical protein LTR98_007642 [Exophiala xenobiotica]
MNQRNKNGDTPLHLVVFAGQAISGRLESAKILLNQGHADVEADSTDEQSGWGEPLRMAARYGDTAMCRVLVEVGGADPRRALKIEDGWHALVLRTCARHRFWNGYAEGNGEMNGSMNGYGEEGDLNGADDFERRRGGHYDDGTDLGHRSWPRPRP